MMCCCAMAGTRACQLCTNSGWYHSGPIADLVYRQIQIEKAEPLLDRISELEKRIAELEKKEGE